MPLKLFLKISGYYILQYLISTYYRDWSFIYWGVKYGSMVTSAITNLVWRFGNLLVCTSNLSPALRTNVADYSLNTSQGKLTKKTINIFFQLIIEEKEIFHVNFNTLIYKFQISIYMYRLSSYRFISRFMYTYIFFPSN